MPLTTHKINKLIDFDPKQDLNFGIFSSLIVDFSYTNNASKLIYTYKSKLLKGLKLCILPHQKGPTNFPTQGGAALDPCQGLSFLDPIRGPIRGGLNHTHGFLRFALDVSPSKQFLKVGSPELSVIDISFCKVCAIWTSSS